MELTFRGVGALNDIHYGVADFGGNFAIWLFMVRMHRVIAHKDIGTEVGGEDY